MRKRFQNMIKDAISHGINLGIELYDDNLFQNDKTLDTDLQSEQLKKNVFKEFDIAKSIKIAIIKFINGDNSNFNFFKKLCTSYIPDYYKIYQINDDALLLHDIIFYFCDTFGDDINLNWIDVSQMTKMCFEDDEKNSIGVFENSTFMGDISLWDMSNVRDMSNMFKDSNFNSDLSKWDVSNVEKMQLTFGGSTFNGDISRWDVSNVQDMGCMFSKSSFNKNISQWNVSNVRDMLGMFSFSIFNKDISKWDIGNVLDMTLMFTLSKFKKNISNWKINENTKTDGMFRSCDIPEEYKPKLK